MNQNKIGQIILILSVINLFHDATAPSGLEPPHYRRFAITLRHTTPSKLLLVSDFTDADSCT